MYSITNDCCMTAPETTSFCTHALILMRREWGSVHMKLASTRRTDPSPRGFFSSSAISSADSGSTGAKLPSRRS